MRNTVVNYSRKKTCQSVYKLTVNLLGILIIPGIFTPLSSNMLVFKHVTLMVPSHKKQQPLCGHSQNELNKYNVDLTSLRLRKDIMKMC